MPRVTVSRLLARVEQLEREVAKLKARREGVVGFQIGDPDYPVGYVPPSHAPTDSPLPDRSWCGDEGQP